MPQLRYLPDVVTLTLDAGKCTGCEMCTSVCPHGVLAVENRVVSIVDRDACMECGACASNCPTQALSVQAGVGCATAVLRDMFPRSRRKHSECCESTSSCCELPDEDTR